MIMRNKKLIIIFSVLCALAVVIVLSSVLFSVQHVSAYCYNADDSALEQQVLDGGAIKRGGSIFLLKESAVKERVENSVENVRVVNIEKKFPNRVYINYVKLFEYFEYEQGGQTYLISNGGKIIKVSEESGSEHIKLYIKGKAISPEAGKAFVSDNDFDNTVFSVITSAIERLGSRSVITELFEWIDFRKNFIYLKTRTGVVFELQSVDGALEKLRLGVSIYADYTEKADPSVMSGTLILAGDKAYYSEKDRYRDGV